MRDDITVDLVEVDRRFPLLTNLAKHNLVRLPNSEHQRPSASKTSGICWWNAKVHGEAPPLYFGSDSFINTLHTFLNGSQLRHLGVVLNLQIEGVTRYPHALPLLAGKDPGVRSIHDN